jgi:hypothetical protein
VPLFSLILPIHELSQGPSTKANMRQSIAIISLLSGAVMAADTIPFYFPGGKSNAPHLVLTILD